MISAWYSIYAIVNFRGLNFRGPHVIHENSGIYVPRKFVQVRHYI